MALIKNKQSLPKNRRVIKFHQAFKNLEPMDEHWEKETFEEREKKIFDLFLEKTGFPPTKHLSYLRECIIPILEVTTLEQLKDLSETWHQRYGIECIQIAIDRTKNNAHFLFDFIDRKKLAHHVARCSYEFNSSHYKYMLMMIYSHLELYQYDLPEDLVRYYLMFMYDNDSSVFQQTLKKIDNINLGKRSYRVIRNSIIYMEQICKDIHSRRYRHRKEFL